MRERVFASFVAALSLSACAAFERAAPAPPVASVKFYLSDSFDPSASLPAPPVVDSEEEAQDLATLKEWQEKRTPRECSRAEREAPAHGTAYEEFMGSISPFPHPMPREASLLIYRVWSDAYAITSRLKNKYGRLRPYRRENSLHPCISLPISVDSYPSGHAVISRVYALVLSDMVPHRRAEFLSRADEVALNRVIGGVHYPSDIAASKLLADEIHAALSKSPAYAADLEKALIGLKH